MRTITIWTTCAFFCGLFATQLSFASGNEGDRNPAEYNLGPNRLALKGYDPVSYFTVGGEKPRVGKSRFRISYRGVVYLFANAKNRVTFLRNPKRYEPTYGGWCAFAMASGSKVDIDPKFFVVQKNRLHLFVNDRAKKLWNQKAKRLERQADQNWLDISGEFPRK